MNGTTSKPYAIFVFGVPMSGKTEFAQKFSHKFKTPNIDLECIEGVDQAAHFAIMSQLAESRQNLLVNDYIDSTKDRAKMRKMLERVGYQTVLVWVQTDINTVKRRLAREFKSVEKARAYLDKRLGELEAPEASEKAIVISGKLESIPRCRTTSLSTLYVLPRK